jgi:hypothetical protein
MPGCPGAPHWPGGLRDHNLSIAHDRARLHAQRSKLIFLSADALAEALALGETGPAVETVLFVSDVSTSVLALLARRNTAGLASFVTAQAPLPYLAHWRQVNLTT